MYRTLKVVNSSTYQGTDESLSPTNLFYLNSKNTKFALVPILTL